MFAQHPTVGIAIESEERLAPEKGVHACGPSRVVVIAGGLGMLGNDGCGSVGVQIGEVVVPCPVEQSDELLARRPDGLAVGEPSPESVGGGQSVAVILRRKARGAEREGEREYSGGGFFHDRICFRG